MNTCRCTRSLHNLVSVFNLLTSNRLSYPLCVPIVPVVVNCEVVVSAAPREVTAYLLSVKGFDPSAEVFPEFWERHPEVTDDKSR
jgi:hypothetical protein